MATEEPKTAIYGKLLIDEKANDLINYLLQLLTEDRNMAQTREYVEAFEIEKDDIVRFVDSYSRMQHEMGWCKDPGCEYWEKNKKKD